MLAPPVDGGVEPEQSPTVEVQKLPLVAILPLPSPSLSLQTAISPPEPEAGPLVCNPVFSKRMFPCDLIWMVDPEVPTQVRFQSRIVVAETTMSPPATVILVCGRLTA
jgi:hypothetical protein